MAYTDILDNSDITVTDVKTYLRIDSDDTASDSLLEIFLNAAKEEADNYCCDNFTTVPSAIEQWILGAVLVKWERRSPYLKSVEQKDSGIVAWAVNYDDYYAGLKPFRREVGFN